MENKMEVFTAMVEGIVTYKNGLTGEAHANTHILKSAWWKDLWERLNLTDDEREEARRMIEAKYGVSIA